MIEKTLFVEVIEAIRQQITKDRVHGESIAEAYNLKVHCVYNNSILIRILVKMLNVYFPPDEDGYCPIEFYCFHSEFGKLEEEFISPEDLYESLISKK